jgi:hypothetical protein
MTVVAVTAKMFLSWLIHFSYVYFELSTKIAYFLLLFFFCLMQMSSLMVHVFNGLLDVISAARQKRREQFLFVRISKKCVN